MSTIINLETTDVIANSRADINTNFSNLNTDKLETSTAATTYVAKADYDANSILYATTDNTPVALTVGASTIVGRKASGDIVALSKTDAQTVLNVADGATANTKAAGTDIDTGTDDAKFATAKAINDSHNVPSVAPGTSGNVMTSNGTDWTSSTNPGTSYISALTTVTESTTTNTDTTITCGFTPKVITIYYELGGITNGVAKYSGGTAYYDSTGTCILNDVLFIDSAATTGTFGRVFSNAAPVSGTAVGAYMIISLSIQSVSSTGCVVRSAFTASGGPGSRSAKFVVVINP